MYNLIFGKRVLEDLNKLDKQIQQRIWRKLQQCKENPFRFLEHLEEIGGFKLRVGDYRLIIDIDISTKTLKVVKIGHRKNIYD